MKIRVDRYPTKSKSTLGSVSVNGVFQCWSLEDVDRGVETNPDAKVFGATAIPRGTYTVVLDYSNRFKRVLPHLLDVPGFEGVRIHPGNKPEDTEGCLLVGGKPTGDDFIPNSRATFEKLFSMMETAEAAGETISVTIA